MTDGRNFFDQPIKIAMKTFDFRKTATGQRDDCANCCFFDYAYFQVNYKSMSIDLRK